MVPAERRRKWGEIKAIWGRRRKFLNSGSVQLGRARNKTRQSTEPGLFRRTQFPYRQTLVRSFSFLCENVSSLYILSIPLKSTHMCAPIFLPDRAQVFSGYGQRRRRRRKERAHKCAFVSSRSVCSTVNNLSPTRGSRERQIYGAKRRSIRIPYLTRRGFWVSKQR